MSKIARTTKANLRKGQIITIQTCHRTLLLKKIELINDIQNYVRTVKYRDTVWYGVVQQISR